MAALGVEEMNDAEMTETNGGGFWIGIGAGLIIAGVLDYLDDPEGFKDSFRRGFNAI